jgi:hypothetical protein
MLTYIFFFNMAPLHDKYTGLRNNYPNFYFSVIIFHNVYNCSPLYIENRLHETGARFATITIIISMFPELPEIGAHRHYDSIIFCSLPLSSVISFFCLDTLSAA